MVWIEATATHQVTIEAPRSRVLEVLRDVSRSGPFFPGVDRIEDLGEGRYRWIIKERRTLGTSFTGNYVAEYTVVGDQEVRWTTVEGNMKTRGAWRLSGPDNHVVVAGEVTTELDAPVPRFMKAPAQLFAVKESRDGLKAQLEGIKAEIESGARSP